MSLANLGITIILLAILIPLTILGILLASSETK